MCVANAGQAEPRVAPGRGPGSDVRAVELPEELLRKRPQNMAPGRRQRGHTGVRGTDWCQGHSVVPGEGSLT